MTTIPSLLEGAIITSILCMLLQTSGSKVKASKTKLLPLKDKWKLE
jgi:hypothetical protein